MISFKDDFGQHWFLVKSFPLSVDLSELATFLRQKKLQYRITEEQGEQRIWVVDEKSIPALAEFIEAWLRGSVQIEIEKEHSGKAFVDALNFSQLALNLVPISCMLILLSIVGYCIVEFESQLQLAGWLTYIETNWQYGGQVRIDIIDLSQPWRIFTPMFLHFGVTHLIFNCLFVWIFGTRIERLLGFPQFLGFVFLIGGLSNIAQFQFSDNAFFGGMSGVNYGLVGFVWIRQMIAPHPLLEIPKSIIYFSLIMLLLGISGFVDRFIDGGIANTAHVTGLILGVSWGFLSGHMQSRKAN